MPTAVAIQCVEVQTPKVPSISGRVVKGLGLMLLMAAFLGPAGFGPPNHIARPGKAPHDAAGLQVCALTMSLRVIFAALITLAHFSVSSRR